MKGLKRGPLAACLAGLALSLAGCASAGHVDATAAAPSGAEGYFIVGVEPPFTRVGILAGEPSGDQFHPFPNFMGGHSAVLMDEPTDGFLVGKIQGDSLLDIDMIQPHSSKDDLLGPIMSPCGAVTNPNGNRDNSKTIVFKAFAGKVVYITSLRLYAAPDGRLSYNTHADLAAARAFLKIHYPNLADKIEQGSFTNMVPTNCSFE